MVVAVLVGSKSGDSKVGISGVGCAESILGLSEVSNPMAAGGRSFIPRERRARTGV
jgi:hypothetical protein